MTNTNLLDKFKWNREYILTHKLDDEVVQEAIKNKLDDAAEIKSAVNESFIEHPEYADYYVSQYGCAISLKGKKPRLLGAVPAGQPDRRYLYYKFMDDKGNAHSISANKAVADVFCPNFWMDETDHRLEAHHIDGQKMHNTWTNLVLLPVQLHNAIHRIKKIVLLKDGIKEYKNPLDLVYDTGLSLEDILLADKSKKKPLKSDSKYTIYDIKGYLVGFQYHPKKKQDK